jgi:riboflavin-specific deaminase-like protein
MGQVSGIVPNGVGDTGRAADLAWNIVLDAARRADDLADSRQSFAFTLAPVEDTALPAEPLIAVPLGHPDAALVWRPATGWDLTLPSDDARHAHVDLYLPVCSATSARPITVGHLGQSLDGFIATHSGDSQYVTGPENILHLHRMRALSDAIVVGAGTVAADDPLLTTRHVSGPSPVRVVLDPARRLGEHYKVFNDTAVETLYVCGRSTVLEGETRFGQATLVAADETPKGIDVTAVLALLRTRGCHRIFVEGGGVTVSLFLEAHLLDRLQVAIAPLIIGSGRPAIRLPPPIALSDCRRPRCRVFRMGTDIFFDCELAPRSDDRTASSGPPVVARVI